MIEQQNLPILRASNRVIKYISKKGHICLRQNIVYTPIKMCLLPQRFLAALWTLVENKPRVHPKNTGMKMNLRYRVVIFILDWWTFWVQNNKPIDCVGNIYLWCWRDMNTHTNGSVSVTVSIWYHSHQQLYILISPPWKNIYLVAYAGECCTPLFVLCLQKEMMLIRKGTWLLGTVRTPSVSSCKSFQLFCIKLN